MFYKALPIWLEGLREEKNIQARFVCDLEPHGECVLYLTGATFYKVYLNGEFIHFGPAPTATGYARVDVLPLKAAVGERCRLSIEVAGYADNSYAAVKQPSYLIAEVRSGDDIIAATGYDFIAYRVVAKEQKTFRYSHQRHFSEVWDMTRPDERCDVEVCPNDIKFLERKAPLPTLEIEKLNSAYCKSKFTYKEGYDENKLSETIDEFSEWVNTNGFPNDEIKARPLTRFSNIEYSIDKSRRDLPESICQGEFAVFEFARNSAAVFSMKYRAVEGTKIMIVFDESLADDKFARKLKCSNIIEVSSSGVTDFQSFDIYGFKYYGVFVVSGELYPVEMARITVRCVPDNIPSLETDDEELLAIYSAACESFMCNSVSIFMDCPTRERAGWLCDSFFMSRAAYALAKNTLVEEDFLDNYVKHGCKTLPRGMVPMCYPGEHNNGRFIPQWSMWLVLELPEYARRNPSADMSAFRDMVSGLVEFFAEYENEFGLLESLPSWNFVEWSRANEWCDGVNFPTNMLYSAFLSAAYELYGDNSLRVKADNIRKTVRELSFDGSFFHDQALRDERGELKLNGNISEVCQYYAFYFDVIDEDEYAELKDTLINRFGPDIDNYPEIEKANALMGIYLRMDLMMKWGRGEQLLGEIKGYFLHMARLTGTLWEHKTNGSSLNHGFPSYIASILIELLNGR